MAEVPSHIHGPSDLAISHSLPSENSSREIDLVFIQDTFENQDKFLSNSVRAIERTCRHILLLPQPSRGNLRVGLVAYHDDPKDDRSPLLQNLQFTSDMEQMIENIHSLQGTQNAANSQGSNVALELALRAAHKLYWRPSADKIVVLSIHKQSRLLGNSGLAVLQLLSNHNIFLAVRSFSIQDVALEIQDLFSNAADQEKAKGLKLAVPESLALELSIGVKTSMHLSTIVQWLLILVNLVADWLCGRGRKPAKPPSPVSPSPDKRLRAPVEDSTPIPISEIPPALDILKQVMNAPATSERANSERGATPIAATYTQKVEFGEKDISLEQTRRVVLKALMSYAAKEKKDAGLS